MHATELVRRNLNYCKNRAFDRHFVCTPAAFTLILMQPRTPGLLANRADYPGTDPAISDSRSFLSRPPWFTTLHGRWRKLRALKIPVNWNVTLVRIAKDRRKTKTSCVTFDGRKCMVSSTFAYVRQKRSQRQSHRPREFGGRRNKSAATQSRPCRTKLH